LQWSHHSKGVCHVADALLPVAQAIWLALMSEK